MTHSFTVNWSAPDFTRSNRRGTVKYKGIKLCCIDTWGFDSCGVVNISQFAARETWPTIVDDFFAWVFNEADGISGWAAKEAYFLLSSDQLRQYPCLVKHPNVRLRDKFTNKAHGPNTLFLFRYSENNDFRRRTLK